MAEIILRQNKTSALLFAEMDANFENINVELIANTDKLNAATDNNVANALVIRNNSGDISVSTVHGDLDGSALQVVANEANTATGVHYITFLDGQTGDKSNLTDVALTYDPSLNKLVAGTFSGIGEFTTLTTTGNTTIGDAAGDVLTVNATPTFQTGVTFVGDIAVNGGDITTSQATFRLVNTTATTVDFAQAATSLTMGATTGTTVIRNALTIQGGEAWHSGNDGAGSGLDADLLDGYNSASSATPNTIVLRTAAGSINAVSGVFSGNVFVNGGNITTSQSTFNLVNDTTTTLNIGGAATSVVLGATTGTTNVRNTLQVDGNEVYHTGNDGAGSGLDADLLDGFQSASAATANTIVLRTANGSINALNGVFGGDVAVNGGDLTTTQATANLFDTTATTINIGGDATTINIGALTGNTNVLNTLTVDGNEVYHTGNDGSGSGLDADLLDGRDSSVAATPNTVVVRDENGAIVGTITGTTDNANKVAVASNNDNATYYPVFVKPADITNGYAPIYADDNITPMSYNPSTNTLTVANFVGNATSADQWSTARTITLGGDLTGNASFDGSSNFTLNAQVVNDSHTHDTQYLGLTAKAADSELLDGINSTSFFRSDANDTKTGYYIQSDQYIRLNDNVDLRLGTDNDFRMDFDGTRTVFRSYNHGAQWWLQGEHAGGTNRNMIIADPDSSVQLFHAGVQVATTNSSGLAADTFTGNATSADKWATARTITLGGDLSGNASFDGSGNFTLNATINANSVALGTDTTGNYVAAGATSGNGISGSVSSEGGTFTVTSNATSANTANTIVYRNASGNFTAGTITAALSGNATTATTLQNSRTINGVAFNGSSNITVEPFVEDDNGTNATRYITFVDNSTSGFKRLNEDSSLTYNPSTNTLTVTNLVGNASTATTASRWATARNITLAGDLSGSTSIDGSANVTITATVADDSHNHVISNVDGLQAALDGKLSTTGKAADSNLLDGLDSTAFIRANADDTVTANTTWADNDRVRLGTSADMQIYHNGGLNYIDCNQDLLIRHGGEVMARFYDDAQVELYYDSAKKFETTNTGATVTGDLTITGGDITLNGTGRIQGVDTVTAATDAANKQYVDDQITNNEGIGVGQTWQDVSTSRSVGTSYQNTTGKPIVWNYGANAVTNYSLQVSSDNSTWIDVGRGDNSGGAQLCFSVIVPDNWYYRIGNHQGGTSFRIWSELR